MLTIVKRISSAAPPYSARTWRTVASICVVVILVTGLTSCYGSVSLTNSDYTRNYDKDSKSHKAKSDWPVDMMFAGRYASVNDVKYLLSLYGYGNDGGTKYLYLKDSPGSSL